MLALGGALRLHGTDAIRVRGLTTIGATGCPHDGSPPIELMSVSRAVDALLVYHRNRRVSISSADAEGRQKGRHGHAAHS